MKEFIKIILISFSVYVLLWGILYFSGVNSLAIQSEDTIPAMFLPVTVIREHTIYADTYYEMIRQSYPHPDDKSNILGLTPFYFKKIGLHYITAFPLITGILAIPVYFFPLVFGMTITWQNLIILSHITSALIISISGGVLYLLLQKYLLRKKKESLLLTSVYLFGTINFALISQALWQHGALQLFILICLYYLYEKKYLLSGVFLGLSILSRPTALLLIPFILLLVFNELFDTSSRIKQLKINSSSILKLLSFLVGLASAFLLFSFYTNRYYLGLENNGYTEQIFVGWLSRFPEGFLGLWLSPSKGILIYSPIFIFSFVGIYLLIKKLEWKNKENFIYLVSLGIVIAHTLILGRWKHWYGGWSFGYRMAADIIPFLVILLIPFIQSNLYEKYKKLFFVLILFSVLVQLFGMVFFDGIWHAAYDRGFTDTSWLWSLKDSELIFNIRRLLVKLGYLDKACPSCL